MSVRVRRASGKGGEGAYEKDDFVAPSLRRLLQDVEDLDDEVVLPMLQHVLEQDDVALIGH